MADRTSIVSSLTLAAMLAAAMMLLWAAAVTAGTTVWTTLFPGEVFVTHSIAFRSEQPVVQVGEFRNGNYSRSYIDLNGKPVEKPDSAGLISTAGLYVGRPWGWMNEANAAYSRIQFIARNHEGLEVWFLVHDGTEQGGIWFECYSEAARQRVTFLGTAGATPRIPPPEQRFRLRLREMLSGRRYSSLLGHSVSEFSGSAVGGASLYLADQHSIRQVNFRERSVTTICDTPSAFVALTGVLRGEHSLARFRDRTFDPADWYLFVLTRSALVRMNAAGGDRLDIPLPDDVQYDTVSYFQRVEGRPLVMTAHSQRGSNFEEVSGAIFDLTDSGELTNRQNYAWRDLLSGFSTEAEDAIIGVTFPISLVIGGTAIASQILPSKWTLRRLWLAIPLSLFSGLLALWLCRAHMATHGSPNRNLWLGFVFLLGLFGYIGYRYHRRWIRAELQITPEREFVGPTMTGIEVLA